MNSKKGTIITLLCIVLLFCSLEYMRVNFYEKPRIEEILKHKQFTDGWITRVLRSKSSRGQSPSVYYIYKINNKEYSDEKTVNDDGIHNIHEMYYNKHFPVIYSSLHIERHDILLNAEDSEKYNIR